MQEEKSLAVLINEYRVFPRLFVIIVGLAYFWFALDAYTWIKGMEVISPVATAFVGTTLSALGGVLVMLLNKYFDTGGK